MDDTPNRRARMRVGQESIQMDAPKTVFKEPVGKKCFSRACGVISEERGVQGEPAFLELDPEQVLLASRVSIINASTVSIASNSRVSPRHARTQPG